MATEANEYDRLENILGAIEKDPTPGPATKPSNADAAPESPDEPAVSAAELEEALAKSSTNEAVEAETGAETPTGETQTTAPEPAKPAIDMPKSWKADQADHWSQLPTEVQKFISEREEERDKGLNAKFTEAAEVRKQAEKVKAEAAQMAQQLLNGYQQQALDIRNVLQSYVASDPVLSLNDEYWRQLSVSDPAKYTQERVVYDQRMAKANALAQQQQSLINNALALAKQNRDQFISQQNAHLYEKLPEWGKDSSLATREMGEVLAYGESTYGAKPEEIHNIADHRLVLLLRNDMLKGREIEALKAENAKLKAGHEDLLKTAQGKRVQPKAPTVATPTAAQETVSGSSQRTKALLSRANKTGKTDDRANAILSIIGH